jgi:membrane-associated phospholipid phosphatase
MERGHDFHRGYLEKRRIETVEQHIKILGILFIISGVLSIMFGMVIVGIFFGSGILTGDEEVLAALSIIGTFIASFSFVTGIPEIIGGWGLLNKKSWSRILIIIMSIINLVGFPIGTALGIYGLWVLFKPESEKILAEQPVPPAA